jgi:OmpA-OmpF porin, OOP family
MAARSRVIQRLHADSQGQLDFETHQFTTVESNVSSSGNASVRIDLASIHRGHDLRDTRMRFQLETFKFPYAQINAKLDKTKLKALATQTRLSYPLSLSLSMHGDVSEIETEVWITRVSETTVSVASARPINLRAESFGFLSNVGRLVDAIEGTPIATGASIGFDLVFKAGAPKPAVASTLANQQKRAAEQASGPLTADACDVRFTVLSQTGAIQFKSGSTIIDPTSEAVLNTAADIANRCGTIKFDVVGHTDNVGDVRTNLQLSLDRAKAVSCLPAEHARQHDTNSNQGLRRRAPNQIEMIRRQGARPIGVSNSNSKKVVPTPKARARKPGKAGAVGPAHLGGVTP